jgi:hypothetical protein
MPTAIPNTLATAVSGKAVKARTRALPQLELACRNLQALGFSPAPVFMMAL